MTLSPLKSAPVALQKLLYTLYHKNQFTAEIYVQPYKAQIFYFKEEQMFNFTDYVSLLNEANKYLGLFNEEITEDTISQLSDLSEEQQKAIFNQLYLIAEQRGHENLFSADQNNFRAFLIDISTDFGWSIQDYMLEVLEGVTPQWQEGNYTDAEQAENLVKDYEQKVRENLHYRRFSRQFPTTVRDYEYKKSFYPSKVGAFINRKIGMLNTSAEIYLQNEVLIDEIKQMITDGDIVISKGHSVNNSNGVLSILETLKTDYSAFSTPVNSYNKDNVISITPYDNLKFLITKQSVLNRIKVREYSAAFNLEQMKLEGRIITVPETYDLGKVDGEDVLFVLLDRRAIVVAIKLWKMGTFYVSNQYKTNHWLGVEGVRGHNTFINAVAYTGETFGNFIDGGDTPPSEDENEITILVGRDFIINTVDDSPSFISGKTGIPVANDYLNKSTQFKNTVSISPAGDESPNIDNNIMIVIGGEGSEFTTSIIRTETLGEIVIDAEHSLIYEDDVPISIPSSVGNITTVIVYDDGAA